MKYAASAIICLLLLSVPVIAAGNSVSQSNYQQANGAGYYSATYQDSANTAIVIGDSNSVSQYNGLNSEESALGGYVYQDVTNSIIVDGTSNYGYQNNFANAFLYGQLVGIEQIEGNLGAITGTGNTLVQNNNAYANQYSEGWFDYYASGYAEAYSNAHAEGTYPYTEGNSDVDYLTDSWGELDTIGPFISQYQINDGLQEGDSNYLNQNNYDYSYIYGAIYGSAYANSYAGAYSDSVAIATGNESYPYAYAGSYADAIASANVLGIIGPITTSQTQSNSAVQTGSSNTQNQNNNAYASISGQISSYAVANANAYADGDAYEELPDYNCPECDVTASASSSASAASVVESVTINQNQANNAILSGQSNGADQNNYANAWINAYVDAESYASSNPTAQAYDQDYVIWECPYLTATSDADANAYSSAYLASQYIEQIQSNNGIVEGTSNYLNQYNDAYDSIDLYAYSDADAGTNPWAYAHGYTDENNMAANAYAYAAGSANAYASAYVGANYLSDTQYNDALLGGEGNVLNQNNYANVYVSSYQSSWAADYFDPYDYQDHPGTAEANAVYNPSANASTSFEADNSIIKTQNNLAIMLNSWDQMSETNNADLAIPGSSNVNVTIYEENNANLA